jgi:ribosomal protein S21
MKKHLSLNIETEVYNQVKNTFPAGQVSTHVNEILKEHLKKLKKEQQKEKLIADYKSTAKSKKMRAEDKVWEGSIEDGINE